MITTKFHFLILILVLIEICDIQAQSQPKKIILSGSSVFSGQFLTEEYSFGSDNSTKLKTSQFNFQPSIGVFASYFIRLGLYADYNYKKEKEDNNYNKTVSTTLGPYFRVYLNDYKIAPFIHTKLGYSRLKLEQKVDNNTDNLAMNGINYGIGLGIEFFIERKYAFELLFDYSGTSVSHKETSTGFGGPNTTWTTISSNGLGFRLGISIFLN